MDYSIPRIYMETKECSTYSACFSQISNATMSVLKFQNNVNFIKIAFPYACLTYEGSKLSH